MKKVLSFILSAMLVFTVMPINALANDIKEISFVPANEIVFYENSGGEWTVSPTQENYYRYSLNFNEGDVLYVTGTNDITTPYTAERLDGEIWFVAENGDKLRQWSDVTNFNNQDDEHWYAGNTYTFYVEYNGERAPVNASVVENPYTKIEFTPKDKVFSYFESGGDFRKDSNEEEFYYYNVTGISTGDILTVFDKNNNPVDYVATYNHEENRMEFISDNDDIISGDDVTTRDEQYNKHFTLGSDNYFYIEYLGHIAPVQVEIIAEAVKQVEYIPAGDVIIYEYSNGDWDTDGEGNKYFRYDAPWFKEGDVLKVTYSDDEDATSYTYGYNEKTDYNGFFDENGEALPDDNELSVRHDGIWNKDAQNSYYVVYKGKKSNDVSVAIVDNPVSDIRFTRANDVVITEGCNMHYDDYDDAYYYDTPWYREGDTLTVIDGSGKEKDYIFTRDDNSHEEYFLAFDGDKISVRDVQLINTQNQKPWKVGSDNEYIIEYFGKRAYLYATILENTVSDICYTRANPVVITENTNGNYDNQGDFYNYTIPWAQVGDILTVVDNNGDETNYVFTEIDNGFERYFVSEGGDKIYDNEVIFTSNQWDNHWSVGDKNEYYVEYSGRRYSLFATVKENDVDEISISLANAMTIYETEYEIIYDWHNGENISYKYYRMPEFREGDILTVTYKDKSSTDYVLTRIDGERYFVNGDEKIDFFDVHVDSNQREQEWTVGAENYFTAEYMGATAKVFVNLIETDVKKISYQKVNPIVIYEETNGEFDFSYFGRFYLYHPSFAEEGDTLRVEYLNGETKVFTVTYDAEHNIGYLESEDGERIYDGDINMYDRQFDEPWKPDRNNFFTVTYHGISAQVPVTIKHTFGDPKVIPPTCTEPGYTLYTCTTCNHQSESDPTAPTGHRWDGGKVTQAPTYDAQGVRTYTCLNHCGIPKTEVIEKLKKTSLSKATVSGIKDKTYTGKSLTQSITVKLGKTTLKNNTDYTVKYTSNKNVGTATLTITGKGKYSGTIKKTFKINPKNTTLSKVTAGKKQFKASWKKYTTQTTGYQIQYSTDKNFKKGNKTVTVSKNSTTSTTVKKLAAKKKYYVRIRTYKTVGKTKYYSDWSKAKTVTTK